MIHRIRRSCRVYEVLVSVIAYGKWKFRVTGGDMAFLKPNLLARDISVTHPLFLDTGPSTRRKLLKPPMGSPKRLKNGT